MKKIFIFLTSLIIIKTDCLAQLPKFSQLPQFQQSPNPKKAEQFNSANSRNGGETEIHFVGSGDIQKSINEGSDFAANTGVGVVFKRKWNESESRLINDFEFDFSINVASSVDTIKALIDDFGVITNSREFGSYLMVPTNSKQAAKFFLNAYFHRDRFNIIPKFINTLKQKRTLSKGNPNSKKEDNNLLDIKNENNNGNKFYLSNIFDGFNFHLIASNRVWLLNDSTNRYVTAVAMRFGLFHDFVPNNIRLDKEQGYSIRIGAGGSFRGIFGDTGFSNNDAKTFRKALLQTEDTKFWGFEVFLGLKLKNIAAEVQVPFIDLNGSVPGLSATQFITSIRFTGGFPLKITNKNS